MQASNKRKRAEMKAALTGVLSRRRAVDLALDVVFAFWLVHVLVTGQIIPEKLAGLLRDEPRIAVFIEPSDVPQGPIYLSDSET